MNKFLFRLILSVCFFANHVFAQVTIVSVCAPGSFGSGSVGPTGVINDGEMVNISSGANRGFVKFDLTSIPPGSVVTQANILFNTVNSTASTQINAIYGFNQDPASLTGISLYNTGNSSGQSLVNASWATPATNNLVLNSAGINFLTTNVGQPNACFTFVRSGSNFYNILGCTSGPQAPRLIIYYYLPNQCTGAPTPGAAVSTGSVICPTLPYTLSLVGASTGLALLNHQWQSSPTGIVGSYVNIPGATSSTYSTVMAGTKFYRCFLVCAPSGQSDISSPVQVIQSPIDNCYCTSTASSLFDEEVTNVSIGILNNNSSCGVVAPGLGSLVSRYSNFLGLPETPLAKGESYPLSVTITTCDGSYSNHTKVYIDYNQNGIFTDAGELVYATPSPSTGSHTNYTNISIPSNAVEGLTRMRVVCRGTTDIQSVFPCGSYDWGETEDYRIRINQPPSCPTPSNLTVVNQSGTNATFTWQNGNTETSWELVWGTPGFTPNGPGELGSVIVNAPVPPATISGLMLQTIYEIRVRAVCTPGDTSSFSLPTLFNTFGFGQYLDHSNVCVPFLDISANALAQTLNLGDDDALNVVLPFSFYYQGELINNIRIANNGGILLDTTAGDVFYTIPGAPFYKGIYPFLQDLFGSTPTGNQYYLVTGTAPNRKAYIQWNNLQHYSPTPVPGGVTFELILSEIDGSFNFVYSDIVFGNPDWDFGADAEIGIRGSENIDISINDGGYLFDNECVEFHYTNCPKPTNLFASSTTNGSITMEWTPGSANEQGWIVEYGPFGFSPGNGIVVNVSQPTISITGLTQLTEYDIYVHANCTLSNDTSVALFGTYSTLPNCSLPTSFAVGTGVDSLLMTWSWSQSISTLSEFKVAYVNAALGDNPYAGTVASAMGINFSENVIDPNLLSGGLYNVYVQARCGLDSSTFVGPILVRMPLTNDDPCGSEWLPVTGASNQFSNIGATTLPNEGTLPVGATGYNRTDGWGSTIMARTTWFKFIAPASGKVKINNTGLLLPSKVAVYDIANCSNFASSILKAANDDDENVTTNGGQGANFVVCGLTPGAIYYLQHSMENNISVGAYRLQLTEISPNSGTPNPQLVNVCVGSSINLEPLFIGANTTNMTAIWSDSYNTGAINSVGIFNSSGLANDVFTCYYVLKSGCAADTSEILVNVTDGANAGTDGTITACKNEPIGLYQGLTGSVDHGGTFYEISNAALIGSEVVTQNVVGVSNYYYVTTNSACTPDTSEIVVTVINCDFLALDEESSNLFQVYPNPANTFVYIVSNYENAYDIDVYDSKGMIVMVRKSITAPTYQLEIETLVNGIYFLKLNDGKTSNMVRVVKI